MPDIPLNPLTSPEPPSASGLDHAALQEIYRIASSLLETNPAEALRLAKICEKNNSDTIQTSPDLSYLIGRAQIANSNVSEGIRYLRTASNLFKMQENIENFIEINILIGSSLSSEGNFEEAQLYLELAITDIDKQPAARKSSIYATALNQLAEVQFRRGSPPNALDTLKRSLNVYLDIDDKKGQINCLINISIVQSSLSQHTESIRSLLEAYQINHTSIPDKKLDATILHNLAFVYFNDNNIDSAIKTMHRAYNSILELDEPQMKASVNLNLGTFYLKVGDLKKSQIYLETALDLSRNNGDQFGEMNTLDSLGNLYEKTEQSLLAYITYHDALAIALSIGSTQGELDARLNLGRFYMHAESWDDAHTQLQLALELAERTQSAKEAATAHETLCELYKARGDAGQALHHSEELRRIERELFNAERDRQTRNLSIQFEVERAQREADSYRLRTELEQEARQMAERQVEERTAELAQAQYEVVTRLAMAAEYRDGTTGDHTRRVGVMSANLARALGWSEARAELLGIAARLHDVGKMGIPDSILLKSGRLEAGEFTQMQTHTLIGATILSGGRSELLQLAEEIALTHHERWDGTGYPRRLAGSQIPPSGRIVAVADVYDALTQIRPYKKAWSHEEAMKELRAQAGRHFDPEVVDAALSVLCCTGPQV